MSRHPLSSGSSWTSQLQWWHPETTGQRKTFWQTRGQQRSWADEFKQRDFFNVAKSSPGNVINKNSMWLSDMNLELQLCLQSPLARPLPRNSPPVRDPSLHSLPSSPVAPSEAAGSHHYLETIWIGERSHDNIFSFFCLMHICHYESQLCWSDSEVIERDVVLLPAAGFDRLISGPSCWWRRPSSNGRPLCPGSPEMLLSKPSLSAYCWTGVPDGSRDRAGKKEKQLLLIFFLEL